MTRILAVAASLLRETARKRSTLLLILVVTGSAIALPHAGAGSGSLRMRLQLAVTYGLGFPAFIIAIATITSAAGLAREVETRRIQMLVTKPLATWQILAGKLAGIAAADAALLSLLLGAFFLDVSWISMSGASSEEERAAASRLFFTPRESILPVMAPPAAGAVKARVESLRKDARASAGLSDAELEARARSALRKLRVGPGAAAELEFRGLPRDGVGAELLLRFQVYSSLPEEIPRVDVVWEPAAAAPGGPAPPPVAPVLSRQVLQGVPHEVSLPPGCVAADGSMRLRLRNPAPAEPRLILIVDPARVEALPVQGRFWPNVLRALALLLAQLVLLTAVGLLAGCACTFPTAVLLGLFLYLTALASGFLSETFALYEGPARGSGGSIERWAAALGSAVIALVPDFSSLDPVGRLAASRAITALDLFREAGGVLGPEAAVCLAAGAWLLRRRELGR